MKVKAGKERSIIRLVIRSEGHGLLLENLDGEKRRDLIGKRD